MTETFAERNCRIEVQAPQGPTLLVYYRSRFLFMLLCLYYLQILIAMFWTLAYSRQCRIDTVHSSIITPRPVWTRYGQLSLKFGMKHRQQK
jgi:hypothetical protein